MTTQNTETSDVIITIATSPRRGIWAAQIWMAGSKAIRLAGQAPTQTSAHGLHCLALIAALRNITKQQLVELAAKSNRRKAVVLAKTVDETFPAALQSKIAGQSGTPLRAGRNLLIELARQIARVDLRLQVETEHRGLILSLKDWAQKTILPPHMLADAGSIFSSAAVSALL